MNSILKIPNHVAIVMDGNGRWASARHLPASAGHLEGSKRVDDVIDFAQEFGIKYLTLFAFSTENWKRSEREVSFLMSLLDKKLREKIKNTDKNAKLKVIGRKSKLSNKLLSLIDELEDLTKNNNKLILNIAIDYGSREEISNASKVIAEKCARNEMSIDDINEKTFNDFLYTNESPDVDLFIRTAGEHRMSNFLLWQSSYAEFVSINTLWPDFSSSDLEHCIREFSERNRTFGG